MHVWIQDLRALNEKLVQQFFKSIPSALLTYGWKSECQKYHEKVLDTVLQSVKNNTQDTVYVIEDKYMIFVSSQNNPLEKVLYMANKEFSERKSDLPVLPSIPLPYRYVPQIVTFSHQIVSYLLPTSSVSEIPNVVVTYRQVESFSFDVLDTEASKWLKKIDPKYHEQVQSFQSFLWTFASWFLIASFSHAIHLTFSEKNKKVYPSFPIGVSIPLLRRILEIPYIEDESLRIKDLILLTMKPKTFLETQVCSIHYEETWAEHVPSPSFPPSKVLVSSKSESLSLQVLISPEDDLVSCCFSLCHNPNFSDGFLSQIDLSTIIENFSHTLHDYQE